MTRPLPIFPARTLVLAASEIFPALALLVWMVPRPHTQAWLWLWSENGFLQIGAVAMTFFLCMYYYDLYESRALKSLRVALTRLPEVLGTACLVLAALYLAVPAIRLRLAVVLLAVATLGLGVALVRQLYFAISRSARLAQTFVMIGEGRLASELAAMIESRPELGIRLANIVPEPSRAERLGSSPRGRAMSGCAGERVSGWILAPGQASLSINGDNRNRTPGNIPVLDGVSLYESLTGKVWLESPNPLRSWDRDMDSRRLFLPGGKRIFSVIVSLFALLALAPVLAATALAIWLDSGHPVIFRQRRVGQGGRLFTLYKFRSMSDGDHGPFRPAAKNDERFTRVGRWLRRTRLDELPQLWNILRGDMSLLGPRPFAWEEEREWARQIPWYAERWKVKPGATGWAQVRRGYCSTREDNVDKLAYDLFYIKHQSPGLDLLILFETTKILLKGRGAR